MVQSSQVEMHIRQKSIQEKIVGLDICFNIGIMRRHEPEKQAHQYNNASIY